MAPPPPPPPSVRALRRRVPRSSWAAVELPSDRDPVGVLRAQDGFRDPALRSLRYGRMATSPFAFLRGAAAVMVSDLAAVPTTGVEVQVCGDAHLANFGLFGGTDGELIFDVNDFDESSSGPWEWDVIRLASSAVVAARAASLGDRVGARAAREAITEYQHRLRWLVDRPTLERWSARVDVRRALPLLASAARREARRGGMSALHHDEMVTLRQLTAADGGALAERPPLLTHAQLGDAAGTRLARLLSGYRHRLRVDRAALLDRFEVIDSARKIVGVGSVGLRSYVVLLRSRSDTLVLQVKQAAESVVDGALGRHPEVDPARRVVTGQLLMQASSDPFLGWCDPAPSGRSYYVRMVNDRKLDVDVEHLGGTHLVAYAGLCGWALARAHARSEAAPHVAAYMGRNGRLAASLTALALRLADLTEHDHALLLRAMASGRVPAASAS